VEGQRWAGGQSNFHLSQKREKKNKEMREKKKVEGERGGLIAWW
jgi:hypothetical protein